MKFSISLPAWTGSKAGLFPENGGPIAVVVKSEERLIINKHMTVLAATSGLAIILALMLSLPATAQVMGSAPHSTAPVQRGSIDPTDLEIFLDEFFDQNMD